LPSGGRDGGAPVVTHAWLAPFREVDLPPARLQLISLKQTSPTTAEIVMTTNATAAFVTLEADTVVGAFSDGGVLMLAGAPPHTFRFVGRTPFALDELRAGLRARSLSDTLAVNEHGQISERTLLG